jgi:uncharacterized protein YdeI (BOF family)
MGQTVRTIQSFDSDTFFFHDNSVETSKKLQVLFLRANKLTDADMIAMSGPLKNNTTIKVLDISSNPDLGA